VLSSSFELELSVSCVSSVISREFARRAGFFVILSAAKDLLYRRQKQIPRADDSERDHPCYQPNEAGEPSKLATHD
jgi:hypothetical protein